MIGYKAKVERTLRKEDLADYLRELAEALDGNESSCCDLKLDCFDKMDMSLKVSGEQAYVRIKMRNFGGIGESPDSAQALEITHGQQSGSETATGHGPFKPLKKQMKESFKLIFKAIHQDALPPAYAVASFLADAGEMATYPGKGDEHYPRFVEACEGFSEAFSEGDMPRMRLLVDDLNHMKAECHAQYK